jgi:hypothetical protein
MELHDGLGSCEIELQRLTWNRPCSSLSWMEAGPGFRGFNARHGKVPQRTHQRNLIVIALLLDGCLKKGFLTKVGLYFYDRKE